MGTLRIRVGTQGITAGTREIKVEILGMREMRGIRVGMWAIRVGMKGMVIGMQVIRVGMRRITVGMRVFRLGMWGMGVEMREISVEMREIRVGIWVYKYLTSILKVKEKLILRSTSQQLLQRVAIASFFSTLNNVSQICHLSDFNNISQKFFSDH